MVVGRLAYNNTPRFINNNEEEISSVRTIIGISNRRQTSVIKKDGEAYDI